MPLDQLHWIAGGVLSQNGSDVIGPKDGKGTSVQVTPYAGDAGWGGGRGEEGVVVLGFEGVEMGEMS